MSEESEGGLRAVNKRAKLAHVNGVFSVAIHLAISYL